MGSLSINVQRGASTMTVFVTGDLHVSTADELVGLVGSQLEPGVGTVEIDLAGVGLIDSTGTKALARVLDRITEHGGTMTVVRPRRAVHRALTASGLVRVVSVGRPYEDPPV